MTGFLSDAAVFMLMNYRSSSRESGGGGREKLIAPLHKEGK